MVGRHGGGGARGVGGGHEHVAMGGGARQVGSGENVTKISQVIPEHTECGLLLGLQILLSSPGMERLNSCLWQRLQASHITASS